LSRLFRELADFKNKVLCPIVKWPLCNTLVAEGNLYSGRFVVASDDAALFLVRQDNTKFDSYFSLLLKIHSLYWPTLYISNFGILWYFW